MAGMAHALRIIGEALKFVGVILLIIGGSYLQYCRAVWVSERKNEKADIQTLFSGRK
jgi:hypothetical protein